ncbi:MAG TPA: hypothetical protein VL551_04095 [Actinospica sp.]|nr:hypothetical protein [Actinospica sp.]
MRIESPPSNFFLSSYSTTASSTTGPLELAVPQGAPLTEITSTGPGIRHITARTPVS